MLMAAGLFILFPSLRRADIEFRYTISSPECVERVALDLFRDGRRVRGHRQAVAGRRDLKSEAKLTMNGEYLAVVHLECRTGESIRATEQPVIVDRDGVIQFKLSGYPCCRRR